MLLSKHFLLSLVQALGSVTPPGPSVVVWDQGIAPHQGALSRNYRGLSQRGAFKCCCETLQILSFPLSRKLLSSKWWPLHRRASQSGEKRNGAPRGFMRIFRMNKKYTMCLRHYTFKPVGYHSTTQPLLTKTATKLDFRRIQVPLTQDKGTMCLL